jgi:SMC interacting uncharacterized protein involved in chromosome segregation
MEIFNKQSKFNENIYEILESAFDNESQECIVDEIIRNINLNDVHKILEILVYQKQYDEKRIKKLKVEIDSKEEHIKHLQNFKDSSVGLHVTDKPIGDLLQMFWQRSSDACPLECSEAEKQEVEFKEWVKSVSWVLC